MNSISYLILLGLPIAGVIWFIFFFKVSDQIEEKTSFQIKDKAEFLKQINILMVSKKWKLTEYADEWIIKARLTWLSFGEIIRISLRRNEDFIDVSSRPKYRKTKFDYNINKKNVKMISDINNN